jgi:hypothetical protein
LGSKAAGLGSAADADARSGHFPAQPKNRRFPDGFSDPTNWLAWKQLFFSPENHSQPGGWRSWHG